MTMSDKPGLKMSVSIQVAAVIHRVPWRIGLWDISTRVSSRRSVPPVRRDQCWPTVSTCITDPSTSQGREDHDSYFVLRTRLWGSSGPAINLGRSKASLPRRTTPFRLPMLASRMSSASGTAAQAVEWSLSALSEARHGSMESHLRRSTSLAKCAGAAFVEVAEIGSAWFRHQSLGRPLQLAAPATSDSSIAAFRSFSTASASRGSANK
jgi:hypothetical protein